MAARRFPVLMLCAALAGPVAAQERQWTLDASGEDAYLIFGVPETDDLGLSIWCPLQQGVVNIFLPQGPAGMGADKDVALSLKAGELSVELKARTEAIQDSGTASIEAQVPVGHPILEAMLNADRLTVKAGTLETIFPLYDADLAGLMDLCRKP